MGFAVAELKSVLAGKSDQFGTVTAIEGDIAVVSTPAGVRKCRFFGVVRVGGRVRLANGLLYAIPNAKETVQV